MKAKRILAAGILLLSFTSSAQSIGEDRTGYLRAQANIAGGYLLSQKDFRPYLTGDFDLFIDDNVSITGEGWYGFRVDDRFVSGLLRNHSLFVGLNYHPVKKGKWDPFIGLSPGIAFVEAFIPCRGGCIPEDAEPNYGVAPLVSGVIGCNYYVGSVFNFFVKVRGVAGRFRGDLREFVPLNELKITAGLGWNVRMWKKKN